MEFIFILFKLANDRELLAAQVLHAASAVHSRADVVADVLALSHVSIDVAVS